MSRGWTWINDNDPALTEEEIDRRTPICDELARQWSALHDQEEQQRFAREWDADEGREYEPEDEEDAQRYEAAEEIKRRRHDAEVDAIETMLAENGARMMRPYEHWNEDERYMQYMECDRFGDSCY